MVVAIIRRMETQHPKSIRRRLLTTLYERYMKNPIEMLTPSDFLEDCGVDRHELIVNMHYLADRSLVELMMGYNPPLFASARITANGIDLVENRFEFNLRFPPSPGEQEESATDLMWLMERLVEEVEFSPLDGEARKNLLRDAQYLREELARPVHRWRRNVIDTVLDWMAEHFEDPGEALPSLPPLRKRISETLP